MKRIILYLLSYIFFLNCGIDNHTKLSGGYIFRHEGYFVNDILGPHEIPENVISCYFNEKFIIAKQMPAKYDNAIYDQRPVYKEGRDRLYYWLIVHEGDIFLGPMNEIEFKEAKIKFKIPEEGELKSIIVDK